MPNILQRFSLAVPLALAVGVPFVLTSESTESLRGSVGSMFTSEVPPGAAATGITDPEVSRLLSLSEQQLSTPVAGTGRPTPVATLEGALRFDITPRWIMDNWPHVSTTRKEGGHGRASRAARHRHHVRNRWPDRSRTTLTHNASCNASPWTASRVTSGIWSVGDTRLPLAARAAGRSWHLRQQVER